jgi:rare lipoprotein A
MFAWAPLLRSPAQQRRLLWSSLMALAMLLGGCASTPLPSSPGRSAPAVDLSRDGPDAVIPPNLQQVPDAEPRIEPIRNGGPNKPYEIQGQRYEPITSDLPLVERGLASWYGRKFHGKPTSNGETYNMYAMSAAHPTMPLPSYARVRNPANGREVIVRVNDRGPFHAGRIIDLSYTAALKLDLLRGVAPVEVERLTFDDIRSGAWRRNNPPPVYLASQPSGAPERSSTASGVDPALLLADARPAPPAVANQAAAGPGYWLQLGAFSQLGGAEQLRQRLTKELDWIAPLLAIFTDSALHRLQAGPYPSREQAQLAAERVRDATRMQPLLVQR